MIDSGVRTTHSEFEGRAILAYNVLEGTEDEDNTGHGTHVAGTIAGATVGVAKKANVVAIKAFDSNVTTLATDVLDAFNWTVDDITSKGREDKSVINLSVGKLLSTTYHAYVTFYSSLLTITTYLLIYKSLEQKQCEKS